MCRISVVIPVYNAEKYIFRAVHSVTCQTIKDIEIILVDDGSADSSFEMCRELSHKDERIKAISIPNGGPGKARNAGVSIASGEFICFLDADDFLEPEMLELLCDSAVKENSDISMCGYLREFYKDDLLMKTMEVKCDSIALTLPCSAYKEYFPVLFKKSYVNSLWNKIYRKSILIDSDVKIPEDIIIGEDLRFNISVLKSCRKISVIDKCLYHYRQINNNSITAQFHNLKGSEQKDTFLMLYDYCCSMGIYESSEKIIWENYFNTVFYICEKLFLPDCSFTLKEKYRYFKCYINNSRIEHIKPSGKYITLSFYYIALFKVSSIPLIMLLMRFRLIVKNIVRKTL